MIIKKEEFIKGDFITDVSPVDGDKLWDQSGRSLQLGQTVPREVASHALHAGEDQVPARDRHQGLHRLC